VLLLIEVADSSLDYDRSVKAALDAAAGLQELWIVDLPHGQMESFRSPGPDGYGDVRQMRQGDQVAPLAFPEESIPLRDILGPNG
jgi:Uma2 family endonuclease